MSKKKSKWERLRAAFSAELSVGPVITQAQVNRLYRDTQIGSPTDTVEELDMQRNNLGPKNGLAELDDLNSNTKTPESKDEASAEKNSEQSFRPVPRP